MDITYAARLIRAWVARREARGLHPNADAVWARIHEKWPKIDPELAERVFQAH